MCFKAVFRSELGRVVEAEGYASAWCSSQEKPAIRCALFLFCHVYMGLGKLLRCFSAADRLVVRPLTMRVGLGLRGGQWDAALCRPEAEGNALGRPKAPQRVRGDHIHLSRDLLRLLPTIPPHHKGAGDLCLSQ